nr:unnamed protein product [uncultured bacterium]
MRVVARGHAHPHIEHHRQFAGIYRFADNPQVVNLLNIDVHHARHLPGKRSHVATPLRLYSDINVGQQCYATFDSTYKFTFFSANPQFYSPTIFIGRAQL